MEKAVGKQDLESRQVSKDSNLVPWTCTPSYSTDLYKAGQYSQRLP